MLEPAAAVRVVPRTGGALTRVLCASHALATLLALLACGPTPPGLLLAGAIVIHLSIVEAERRALAEALAAVLLDSAGVWQLQWTDGTREVVRLLPGRCVSPWLTALSFRSRRGRVNLLICPDMIDDASFRRLRTRLLWHARAPDTA